MSKENGARGGFLHTVLVWVPPVLLMAAIFIMSAQPHLDLPGRLGRLDKVQHFGAYMALAALLFRAFMHRPSISLGGALAASWIVAAAYGASDELHQWFVPGRRCEVGDWLMDMAGAFVGLMIVWLAYRRPPRDDRTEE